MGFSPSLFTEICIAADLPVEGLQSFRSLALTGKVCESSFAAEEIMDCLLVNNAVLGYY